MSGTPLTNILLGDFDGDGRTDALAAWLGLWHISKGATEEWVGMGGAGHHPQLMLLRLGDFDGDGKTDLFRIWYDVPTTPPINPP